MRCWLESNGRGWRFCTQTQHPTKGTWNAVKRSTYASLAAAMYLDDEGKVKWAGLSEYSSAEQAEEFARKFPGADLSTLALFAKAKALLEEALGDRDVAVWSRIAGLA